MATSDNSVLEHLKMIQSIMDRMNRSSTTMKSFCLPTFSAVLLFGFKERCLVVFPFLLLLVIIFLAVDMFYLWQERLFKKLYNKVRLLETTDYSMDRTLYKKQGGRLSLLLSPSIFPIYGTLLIISVLSFLIVGGYL